MKTIALVLTLLGILGIVAAQIPLKPPPYYGAPSTPKKKKPRALRPRGAGAHMVKAHMFHTFSSGKSETAGAEQSEEKPEETLFLS
ncbi:hypothetical protein LX36DRAFT_654480 [Colletotrichum falcatum]|nr:hypothetical protein LX36DRAFT_654480 [Colletotrichum falcatum]